MTTYLFCMYDKPLFMLQCRIWTLHSLYLRGEMPSRVLSAEAGRGGGGD